MGFEANEDRSLRLRFRPVGAIRTSDPNSLPPATWVGLHGWGGSPRSFEPLAQPESEAMDRFRSADAQAEKGARLGQIWSGALFGHQGAPVPSGFASAIDGLAHSLPPPPRYAVAYSFGARLALAAWAVHPDLWIGVTLIGVHPGLPDPESREARRRLDAERAQALQRRGVDRFFAEWDRQPLFGGRIPRPELRRDHDPEQLARVLLRLGLADMPDLNGVLRNQVQAGRAQLLVGESDTKFRTLLEPMGAQVVQGCAHDVLTERPQAVLQAALSHARSL